MINSKKSIRVLNIGVILLSSLLLASCQNSDSVVDSEEVIYETMSFNDLYDEKLITTSVFNLDKKYNNLEEQISYMRKVSEYNDGSAVEDFDTIFLGKIEQDGIYDNGKEDIEWILLYRDDEKAILQSKYIIDEIDYLKDLLDLLNKKYRNELFDKEEIGIIQKMGLLRYEDLIEYYGDVGIEEYRESYSNGEDVAKNKVYNNKIATKETDYVKKVIYNDNKRKQATYYKFQEEENYKNNNVRIDDSHSMVGGYYFLESDLIYNDDDIPFCFEARDAVSNAGIVEKNFCVSSDYLHVGENNYIQYLSGLRPIIYVDLKKAKNFKIKNEYKKYKYYELKKGQVFDISNIKNVHSVREYPDNTYLENIESVVIGSVSEADKEAKDLIEWIVLDKVNGAYLLMSKYPIALKRFDEEGRNVDYLNSSIRKWLNDEFYNNSFTNEQKKKIKTVKYKVNDQTNNIEDKVFLLSAADISEYFAKHINYNFINIDVDLDKLNSHYVDSDYLDSKKLLSNTMLFNYRKTSVHKKPFSGKWNDFHQGFLLRDNGDYDYLVKYIDNDGNVRNDGTLTDMPYIPIRPAIYVSDKKVDIKIDYDSKARNAVEKIDDYKSIIGEIDNIFIGKCEQDGDLLNGKEDIEWSIIGKEDDDLILISKYILDAEKINKNNKICKYENSLVRNKLLCLYNEYFNDEEKSLLIERRNINYKSVLDGENGSEKTDEKLFILSIDDIRRYIGDTNKSYDVLKSENTYYLNTRNDIQRMPNDLYLNDNYFLRSIGAIGYSYYIDKTTFNGKNVDDFGGYETFWSNVDKNGQVKFIKVNDYYNNTEYYSGVRDSLDIIIDDIYMNGIRPCIKVNINSLKEYLSKDRNINIYKHKKIDKGKIYSIDEIAKVKELKKNEDYKSFDYIDMVKFGKYKLDKDSKACDLEWFVLSKVDDKALLLSKYLIDKGKFDFDEIWGFSDVRKKLNGDFYNNSFNDKEKEKILTTLVESKGSNQEATHDKVFLLDEKLINEYILDGDVNNEKYLQKFNRLKVSKYLKDFVISYNRNREYGKLDYEAFAPYCLNNNNENDDFDPYVDFNGQIYYRSWYDTGIRPVKWIKLDDKVIDEYEVKPKMKKYAYGDVIEDKIRKSDDISKYSVDNKVEDFDIVEFGKFFQGEEGKDNSKGKIYYNTMDTIDEYNELFINNKNKYSSIKLKYDKSMDKNIEWIILDKNDDYALLMSKYILYTINEDGNSFDEWHNNDREFVYAESRTRKWLNEVFYNLAFSDEEKEKISKLSFDDCSQKGTNEIKTFYDNVSILNSVELAKYFGYISKNDVNKKIPTKATGYALGISRNYNSGRTGLKPANDYRKYGFGNSNFIVRSYSITSKIINSEGKLDEEEYTNITGVRPVIKVSLNAANPKNIETTNNKLYYDEELSKTVKVTKTFEESAKLGPMHDTIKFGKYEQDNNLTNGKEDIEWYVLKKENDKALIMSKDILDLQVYDYDRNRSYMGYGSRFDSSFLYEWLNLKFVNDAFDAKEIKNISDTGLYDEKKEYNDTKKESEIIKKYYLTKAFILTIDEINEYLNDGAKMKAGAYASKYVQGIENKAGGIFVNSKNGFSPYWTRTYKAEDVYTGYNRGHTVIVDNSSIADVGCDSIDIGVRPVLWVNIK